MTRVMFDSRQFALAHHIDCGVALMRSNRHAQAILEYEEALKIDPNDRYARWGRCLANLSIGNYRDGMPEHDWAWQIYAWHSLGPIPRIQALRAWKGERCRLLVFNEMGNGDCIMLMRFLPWLAERNDSVTLLVRPELADLCSGRGAAIITAEPEDCSGYDAQVSLFNAIHVAGWTENIPASPYIERRIRPVRKTMGVVWSGNSQTNFTLRTFLHHLDTTGYDLFSMQKTASAEQQRELNQQNVCPLPDDYDFLDSAKFMAGLDVVVSVDTAAAHLAGAMAHPNAHVVIPYLRDWRWWHKERWYPTLNIYPQDDAGNWDAPFARVNEAIHGAH